MACAAGIKSVSTLRFLFPDKIIVKHCLCLPEPGRAGLVYLECRFHTRKHFFISTITKIIKRTTKLLKVLCTMVK